MKEIFGSESSSGCESGWTLYLEHSLKTHKNDDDLICEKDAFFTYEVDDEEEDMSMVSDASSGPQHFPEQEDERFESNGGAYTNGERQKIPKDASSCLHKKIPSFLDDTASSPFFNFSNINNLTVATKKASVPMAENEIVDYSQGYSTTYFRGKSAFEEQLGFLQPVSGAENQLSSLFCF